MRTAQFLGRAVLMNLMRARFTKGLAGFLVLFWASSSFADTCIFLPLKPVRHVCGIVMNQAGERISNARLTLLKGGTELVTVETDANGRFDFKTAAAGNYVLRASMQGCYVEVRSAIKIVRPIETCKQALEVMLPVSMIHCGGGKADLDNNPVN